MDVLGIFRDLTRGFGSGLDVLRDGPMINQRNQDC